MKVSCIMPTANRRDFIPIALACFRNQTWQDKELVIVEDGADNISDLLQQEQNIIYHHLDSPMLLGDKRNLACQLATGDIIAHWDDDDYYAPDRLTHQVEEMTKSGKPVFGYHSLLFYNFLEQKVWRYDYPITSSYACGASLMFTKEYWEKHPFESRAVIEDNQFNKQADSLGALYSTPGLKYIVATVHTKNSSARNLTSSYTPVPIDELPEGVKDLWSRIHM